MTTKLSIIVPVYNGEQYIESCLRSATQQLTAEIELIVVNDGSSDATDHIITTAFQAYIDSGQLVYLPTANFGVSAARNRGLDHATGAYVSFLDADDLLHASYVQTILAATVETPNIIEFGYRSIDQHGNTIKSDCFAHTQFGRHADGAITDAVFSACLWYPFLRAFKRSLFEKIRFPVGVRFCEDVMTLSEIYKQGGEILSLPQVLYDYRCNPAGATFNTKADYATNLIDFYRTVMPDQSFANKALKINLAYAIRGCLSRTTDPLGRMPKDIENDVRRLVLAPRLLFCVRGRFVIFALFGPALFYIKRYVR